MTVHRYPRSTYYLIAAFVVFLALLWTSAAVHAQDETPEPTPVVEPVVVVPDAYDAAINGLSAVVVALIVAGGAAAVAMIFRNNPAQAKTTVNTGIDVLDLLAKFTKSPVDDEALQRIRTEFNARIDQILLNMTPPAPTLISSGTVPRTDGTVTTTTTTTTGSDTPPPPTESLNG